MTVFVERDQNGGIKGVYRVAQYEADGTTPIAIEEMADDAAEVVAYLAPPAKRTWTLSEFKARLQPAELAALGELIGKVTGQDAALLLDFLTAETLSLAPVGGPAGKLEIGLARLVTLGVITDERRQALLQPE